ncbi:MAG TPA: LON peptidase substrate-binding domain-containing protein [Chloroflexota bacterium]|nr:LON peptidase substrate-binding domain-containing protein [Chloroflexota bacterium]
MASRPLLPLFPLLTVLFPGNVQPLHIFEERYKLMVRRCRESDGMMGVVAIRRGDEVGMTAEPYDVGTLARITRIDALSEGRINLTVVGERRFRITQLNDEEPYLRGEVEIISDDAVTVAPEAISAIREGYVDYIRLLRRLAQRTERVVRVPDETLELSYVIAARLHISRLEQQGLLEASVDNRLRLERDILRRELALLRRLGAVSTRRTRSSPEITPN